MKKFLLSSVLTISLLIGQTASAAETSPAFSDVNENTNYVSSISWMADNGVIEGYPDGTFKPDQCVNRAEFLKMLYLTLESDIYDIPSGTTYISPFSDVIHSEWYAQYVQYALQQNTIEGYPDGTFKPGQCVNRVEAIKMATLEFHDGVIENIPDYYGQFADEYSDISEDAWYYQYLVKAFRENSVGLEHVTGEANVDLKFYPGDSMSRKEVAEMLYRMKIIKDNNQGSYSSNYMVSIDASWNKYINNDLGFSIQVPKTVTNSLGCFTSEADSTTSPVTVFTDTPNNAVYISTDYAYNDQCELVKNSLSLLQSEQSRAPAWKIVFQSIQNSAELDQFIKDVFLAECTVEDLQPAIQEDVFTPELNYSNEGGVGCFINWVSYTYYSPSREKAVHWDVGQDSTFVLQGTKVFDEGMAESFRFE